MLHEDGDDENEVADGARATLKSPVSSGDGRLIKTLTISFDTDFPPLSAGSASLERRFAFSCVLERRFAEDSFLSSESDTPHISLKVGKLICLKKRAYYYQEHRLTAIGGKGGNETRGNPIHG